MSSCFQCSKEGMEYLRSQDAKLAGVMDAVGEIHREMDPDLFSSVVHQIISQQISTKAQLSIWKRMQEKLGRITPETILGVKAEDLKSCGISMRKAEYIQNFARQVQSGSFDLKKIETMSDEQALKALCSLKGVGDWTAEMILLFCLHRQDVFSFHDFGILKGLRMVYGHEKIDRELFEQYRKRFSPYGSIASLYFWAVAAGEAGELKDPAAQRKQTGSEGLKPSKK